LYLVTTIQWGACNRRSPKFAPRFVGCDHAYTVGKMIHWGSEVERCTKYVCGYTDFLMDELRSFTGYGWEQEDDITLVTLQRSAQ
jgi:hypothetical protein